MEHRHISFLRLENFSTKVVKFEYLGKVGSKVIDNPLDQLYQKIDLDKHYNSSNKELCFLPYGKKQTI